MLKRDWAVSWNIDNFSTLISEHNWEDLCIQFIHTLSVKCLDINIDVLSMWVFCGNYFA